jgi:hypothetical protein
LKKYSYLQLSKLDNTELIEYIEQLQGQIYEYIADNDKLNQERSKYNLLVSDLLSSCNQILKDKEEFERGYIDSVPDTEQVINNLKKYILDFLITNKIKLY